MGHYIKWDNIIVLLEKTLEEARGKAKLEIRRQTAGPGFKVTCNVDGLVETVSVGGSGAITADAKMTAKAGMSGSRSSGATFECEVFAWKWRRFELEVDYDLDLDLDLIGAVLEAYDQRRKVIYEKVRKKIRVTKRAVINEEALLNKSITGKAGATGVYAQWGGGSGAVGAVGASATFGDGGFTVGGGGYTV